MAKYLGEEKFKVNSFHHQAVKTPAPGIEIAATSSDGVVEAIYHKEKRFVWGVQWHPESIWDISEENRKIAEEFLRAAR